MPGYYSMEQNQENHALSEITDKFGKNLKLQSSIIHDSNNNNNVCVISDIEHENEDEDNNVRVSNDNNEHKNEDEDVYVRVSNDNEHENEDGDEDFYFRVISDHENENEDEDDFEFSFFGNEIESPVTADEAFHNGQIRSTFPLFGESATSTSYAPPVKKMFVAEGPYCTWSTAEETAPTKSPPVSPEMSRKSNSTGFSRLWRMKDYFLVRSNSDGKDTLVFFTGKGTTTTTTEKKGGNVNSSTLLSKNEGGERKKKGKKTVITTASATAVAYEELYGKRKGGGKSSYLTYRQVGFFSNVNGLTRNVHPY